MTRTPVTHSRSRPAVNSDIPLFRLAAGAPAGLSSGLLELRQRGSAAFARQGVPGRHTEACRYSATALAPVLGAESQPLPSVPLSLSGLPPHLPLLAGACPLLVVNGRWQPDLAAHPLPGGVTVRPLEDALADPAVRETFGQLLPVESLPFAALADSLAGETLVIHIAAGASIDQPLQLIFASSSVTGGDGSHAHAVQPRLLLLADEDSRATVVECHYTLLPAPVAAPVAAPVPAPGAVAPLPLSMGGAELRLAARARLHHVALTIGEKTATHLLARQVKVGEGASYDAFALTVGEAMVRQDIGLDLAAPGATATLNGASAIAGEGLCDTSITVAHNSPRAVSSQNYRSVVDDRARAVFQGRILVQRNAVQTDGRQNHRGLLLSGTAEINVKPELFIYADDVSCAHGATCGELDEEALFYLQARGIDEATARRILIEGFVNEVLDGLEDEDVQSLLHGVVSQWLSRPVTGGDK